VDRGDCWRMARPMCRPCYTLEESRCTKCTGGTSTVAESGAGQNFSFPSPTRSDFEFEDEDTSNKDSSDPSHREEGTSATRSMSPMTEASQCTAGTVPVPVPDGLPIGG
jgi:hypothetical protein